MREHDWKQDSDGAWSCARSGCTVRRSPDAPVWQRRKGAHWRNRDDEPIPECAGTDTTTWVQYFSADYVGNTPKASLPGKRAQPASSPLARVREALEKVAEVADPIGIAGRAAANGLAALTTLEAALPVLMATWHEDGKDVRARVHLSRDWGSCSDCAALLEGK